MIEPIAQVGSGPVTDFQVLGERSSGTNLVETHLRRSTNLTPSKLLGWKHGFPHALGIPDDLLVVGVVRNAVDWTRSMFVKPWHTGVHMHRLGFTPFIRHSWDTYVDRADYFGLDPDDPRMGTRLQLDLDPLTGQPFEHILALRNAKAAALLGMTQRAKNAVVFRMEDIVGNETALIETLASLYNVKKTAVVKPIARRLGSKYNSPIKDRPALPEAVSSKDKGFFRSRLDLEQESRLGYEYSDEFFATRTLDSRESN